MDSDISHMDMSLSKLLKDSKARLIVGTAILVYTGNSQCEVGRTWAAQWENRSE